MTIDAGDGEAEACIVQAVQGYLRTIALGMSSSAAASDTSSNKATCVVAVVLQDTLRLLTLWFAHGARPGVHAAVAAGAWVWVVYDRTAQTNTHP